MRNRLILSILALLALLAAPAAAEDPLAEHLWTARPVIVFADTDRDPRLVRQIASLDEATTRLEERDVVVIVDTEPGPSRSETTDLRKKFRPHGFTVILVDKDGQVKLRKPAVVTADALIRFIDRTPLRQQEIGRR